MIINNNIQSVAGAYSVSSTTSSRQAGRTEKVREADAVQLSTGAQSFSGLLQQLHSMDATRTARVDALSQQIADGSYEVPAGTIAGHLLDTRF